jgi:glycogen phosphorylase
MPVKKGDKLVAYFCAEYGISDQLPIYSGGLGVLAGDILQEAAAQKVPMVAIGLFYHAGFFHQKVDETGQHELPAPIDPVESGLELMRDGDGETLLVPIPIGDHDIFAQVWKWKIGATVTLYLLDTDHWRNTVEEDRLITDQLYTGDKEKRLRQEMVLGVGGYRFLQHIGQKPAVYHMNEGHSAFLALELIGKHLREQDVTPEHARKLAGGQLRFTNHTLVAAGNDSFPNELIRTQLRRFIEQTGLSMHDVLNWGNSPGELNTFSMTMLALRCAGVSTAVSRLHAEKARSIWPTHPLTPITNGVFLPGWVAPEMQKIFDVHSPAWRTETSTEASWGGIRRMPHAELWHTHCALKRRLLAEIEVRTGVTLEERALTIVWARRFTAYKRPDLLFNDLDRLKKVVLRSDRPIQIIVAGKAHPADIEGKEILKRVKDLTLGEFQGKIVFVEDYSITLARLLVAGADIWLNTPIHGLEASGTSGMKAASNGAIQVTVSDGWANEVDWYGMGFVLPAKGAEHSIYELLERKVIPSFFRRTREDIPDLWVAMMQETIATVAPNYSATRMVEDYITQLYS